MPEREFSSPDGRRWRVWEVHPRDVVGERRRAVERRVTPVEQLLDPPVLERRVQADRRTTPARPRPQVLPQPWQDGWIVFEEQAAPPAARREARRLAPIPPEWTSAPETELAAYLARAVAPRAHPS